MKRLRHKLIRLLEQPTIPKDLFNRVRPCHTHSCLIAKELNGEFKTLIDVGANRGDFSRAFLFSFKNSKVYAFEPLKEHQTTLEKMKISVSNFGLWNENKKLIFNAELESDGVNSSFLKPRGFVPDKRELEVKRFDALNIPIERPCFLKIDTEGTEDKVLEGFGKRLNEVDIIQVEILHKNFFENKAKFSDILKIVEKYNFVGFKQINITYSDGKPDKSDIIFFR